MIETPSTNNYMKIVVCSLWQANRASKQLCHVQYSLCRSMEMVSKISLAFGFALVSLSSSD